MILQKDSGLAEVHSLPSHRRGVARKEIPEDADTAPATRAHASPAADTVRAVYRRYRHPARGRRLVRAAARPGISCHSAAWGAHRRRSARIFLTGLVLYQWAYPV